MFKGFLKRYRDCINLIIFMKMGQRKKIDRFFPAYLRGSAPGDYLCISTIFCSKWFYFQLHPGTGVFTQ